MINVVFNGVCNTTTKPTSTIFHYITGFDTLATKFLKQIEFLNSITRKLRHLDESKKFSAVSTNNQTYQFLYSFTIPNTKSTIPILKQIVRFDK